MRVRIDGSIQSSNIPTEQNIERIYDYGIYRCMVIKIIFTDKNNYTENAKNPRVLYDVVILGGLASGQIISNCRMASDLGGVENYHEVVLKATTKDLTKERLEDHDGDIIFLQFIQGDLGFPIIITSDNNFSTKTKIGATESDGIREIRQFNGVKEEITKTGEFTITRQGGSVKEEVFVADEGTPRYKEEFKDPELLIRTFKSGMIIKEDGENDKITITLKSGTILDIDGTTGKIHLSGALVDIGESVSDLAVLFSELASNYNSHTHIMAAHTHPGGGPASPADNLPPAPLPSNVASQTIRLAK